MVFDATTAEGTLCPDGIELLDLRFFTEPDVACLDVAAWIPEVLRAVFHPTSPFPAPRSPYGAVVDCRTPATPQRCHVPAEFDPGYGQEPFRTLVQDVTDSTVFPTRDFRTEWGPVFHRGRLDGSAAARYRAGPRPTRNDPASHVSLADVIHPLPAFNRMLGESLNQLAARVASKGEHHEQYARQH